MKKCPGCNEVKDLSNFYDDKKRKNKSAYCKSCFRNRLRKDYQNRKKYHLDRTANFRKAIRLEIDNIKSEQGCLVCGESESSCLDFHHKDHKTKTATVSKLVTHKSRAGALKEIEKCIVLCSNCHRKFHAGLF